MPQCCAECLGCMLPRNKMMYCILTSEPVSECCSRMIVLPDSEQDPTPTGCCHPAVLRIKHLWKEASDPEGPMKSAIGELTSEGIRYQDTT